MGVDHEIAHERVVDGFLRLAAPGGDRLAVAGIGADKVDLGKITERVVLQILKFYADD